MASDDPRGRGTRPRMGALIAAAILVPTALAGLSLLWPRPGIEDGLTGAARASLRSEGLGTAQVEFRGRDATVSGVAGAEAERALQVVRDVDGVRVAEADVATDAGGAGSTTSTATPAPTTTATPTPATPEPDPGTRAALQERVDALEIAAPITFEPDSAVPTPTGAATLAQVLEVLRSEPTARVRVDGFVATGPGEGTLTAEQLSAQRAVAVRDALVAGGVAPDRVTAQGLGEGPTPVADAAGRRVDVVVV